MSPSSQKREKFAPSAVRAGKEDVMATGQQVPTRRSTAIEQLLPPAGVKIKEARGDTKK